MDGWSKQNHFRGSVPCIKRSIPTEGIRDSDKIHLPILIIVWLHKVKRTAPINSAFQSQMGKIVPLQDGS